MVLLYVTLASHPGISETMPISHDDVIDMRDDNDGSVHSNNWDIIKNAIYRTRDGTLEEKKKYQVTPNMFKHSKNLHGVLEDPLYEKCYKIITWYLPKDWVLHAHKEIT